MTDFGIYIDPSGTVVDQLGHPITGATVTLFRSDSSSGPFDVVPDGSALMSPSQRTNPMVTTGDGIFHWDVLAGFYQVAASAPGCTVPGSAETVVRSDVLEVPPPALDITLHLDCPSPYSDLAVSNPFFHDILWLADRGITTGYANGTFRPSEAVKRQAMAAFLYRYAGSPAYALPDTARFSDVPVGAPFRKEIEWLAATGVTTGIPDPAGSPTFNPLGSVSRQAMAAFLYR